MINPHAILEDLTEKQWLKKVKTINSAMFCEVLIIQLTARQRQLNAKFKSYTPMRQQNETP